MENRSAGRLRVRGGIVAAGALAAVIGAVAVLTRGFYFIMVTLAFGEMMFSLFHDTRFAGGSPLTAKLR